MSVPPSVRPSVRTSVYLYTPVYGSVCVCVRMHVKLRCTVISTKCQVPRLYPITAVDKNSTRPRATCPFDYSPGFRSSSLIRFQLLLTHKRQESLENLGTNGTTRSERCLKHNSETLSSQTCFNRSFAVQHCPQGFPIVPRQRSRKIFLIETSATQRNQSVLQKKRPSIKEKRESLQSCIRLQTIGAVYFRQTRFVHRSFLFSSLSSCSSSSPSSSPSSSFPFPSSSFSFSFSSTPLSSPSSSSRFDKHPRTPAVCT